MAKLKEYRELREILELALVELSKDVRGGYETYESRKRAREILEGAKEECENKVHKK